MAESYNKSHFMDLTVMRLYYSSIRLDYFFIGWKMQISCVYPK